jgi:hypothetical protein
MELLSLFIPSTKKKQCCFLAIDILLEEIVLLLVLGEIHIPASCEK